MDKQRAQILRYIEENYVRGSLSHFAAQAHYDPAALSRQIKRLTGKTFVALVREKRLQQAAFLLESTTKKVSEIAACVGYANPSHFHRLFADHFGTSPQKYRNTMKDHI